MSKIANPTKVITGVNTRRSYAKVNQWSRTKVQRFSYHSKVRYRNRKQN